MWRASAAFLFFFDSVSNIVPSVTPAEHWRWRARKASACPRNVETLPRSQWRQGAFGLAATAIETNAADRAQFPRALVIGDGQALIRAYRARSC